MNAANYYPNALTLQLKELMLEKIFSQNTYFAPWWVDEKARWVKMLVK